MKGRKPKPLDPTVTVKGPFATDRDIFERQPWDNDESWAAFLFFRSTNPSERSLRRTAAEVGRTRGTGFTEQMYTTVQNWSAHGAWRSRVDMWDLQVDRERRKQFIKDAIDMRERHAKLGKGMQQLGGLELKKFLETASKNKTVALTANDIRNLIDLGIRVEREAKGEPGSIVEERRQITGDEERESMRSLLGDREALDAARKLVARIKHKHESSPPPDDEGG